MNTKFPRGKDRYVDKLLEQELRAHHVLQQILAAAASSPHASVVKELDEEKAQYMRASEKRCRKTDRPFSDKSTVWIRRRQVYHHYYASIGVRYVIEPI